MSDERRKARRGTRTAHVMAGPVTQRSTIEAREQERERRATAEELIGMVAHDLRGYLTPIDGYVALLRASAEREGRARDAQRAAAAAAAIAALARLASRLLTARRLDRGPLVPDVRSLDLTTVVRETVSAVTAPGAVIHVEAPEQAPCVGDPDLLREVLANLLTNALRHSPPDAPVSVRVALAPEGEGARPQATVWVSDRGSGIAPHLLPHIFERFSADADSPGLGLGLYLAREIARAHAGDLTVEATDAHGTTFHLVLPLTTPP